MENITQTEKFGNDFESLEQGIRSAESFDELYAALEEAKVIEGSKQTYSYEEIKASIETIRDTIQKNVRAGVEMVPTRNIPFLANITRVHQLRAKVVELLDKEISSIMDGREG